jgi:pimeloyl-ACP methyl ester carboxylesterase
MTRIVANEIALGIESFGDDDAPLVLLAGGTTMLSWPDALCERLAAGGRRVVRYDLRDSGESTTTDPEAPAYTLRGLGADAAALADALGGGPAHLAGIGVGGMVAQVAVLDHPGVFSALTLVGTRAVAPGPPDDDLPDHDQATMSRLFARPMPDWTDREAVAEFAAAGAEILGDDPVAARAIAARIWDRTPGTAPPVQMANQMGLVFAGLDCSSSRRPPLRSPVRWSARSPRRCSRSDRGRRVPRESVLRAAVDVGGSIRPRACRAAGPRCQEDSAGSAR